MLMLLSKLLVIIPHGGILIPHEIKVSSLTPAYPVLARNIDWYTDWLYDFRDILGNAQLTFPYCSLILEANRDPDNLDSSVPLRDALGEPLYLDDCPPDLELRRSLSVKYLYPFHQRIEALIEAGGMFMLEGHSTVTAKGMVDNQIELMNYQTSPSDKKMEKFCPDIIVETYAGALAKRLPRVKVTLNESRYHDVYGHICGAHAVDATAKTGKRVPAILQETNQSLYINSDRTPNLEAIETLRRAFAGALSETVNRFWG